LRCCSRSPSQRRAGATTPATAATGSPENNASAAARRKHKLEAEEVLPADDNFQERFRSYIEFEADIAVRASHNDQPPASAGPVPSICPGLPAPPVTVGADAGRAGQQIRVTVDLDRDTHRGLRQLALDADADATEVVRLLIGRAFRDPGAAESIRAELDELG
jgi:hypothetical protein